MLMFKGIDVFEFDEVFSVIVHKSNYVSSLYRGLNVIRGNFS